jgi:YVTN family beta-propeller protein
MQRPHSVTQRFPHNGKSQRRDRTGWLGCQDSNLGMAESKSTCFAFDFKDHSKKSAKFDPFPSKIDRRPPSHPLNRQRPLFANRARPGANWVTISPDDKTAYVANPPTNDVSVVDIKSLKEVARVPVGFAPSRNTAWLAP